MTVVPGGTSEVRSIEPRDAPDIEINVARELLLAVWHRALEQLAFDVGEGGSSRCFRCLAAEHREP